MWEVIYDNSQLIVNVILVGAVLYSNYLSRQNVAQSKEFMHQSNIQTQQISEREFMRLSNEQNWHFYLHHKEFPTLLPSWEGLNDEEWGLRTVYLFHLNMLDLVYKEFKKRLMNEDQIEAWIRKGKHWFYLLGDDSNFKWRKEGRNILMQLLKPEEGYTDDFRKWLFDKRIIPTELSR